MLKHVSFDMKETQARELQTKSYSAMSTCGYLDGLRPCRFRRHLVVPCIVKLNNQLGGLLDKFFEYVRSENMKDLRMFIHEK